MTIATQAAERNPLNILYSRASTPFPHTIFFEKAFRKKHRVITYGPTACDKAISSWHFESIKDNNVLADIPFFTMDILQVLKKIPWTPDLFFFTDTLYSFALEGISKLPCPTACFLLDPQYETALKIEMAKKFDFVFISQLHYLQVFSEAGIKNVFWLPHACDRDVHGRKPGSKIHDISFVGTLTEERQKIIDDHNIYFERCFAARMAEVFSRSKIVLNLSSYGEINMRVFEAMASGSLLLTDTAPDSGLKDLFEDRRHLVYYNNEEELSCLSDYYLLHDEEREAIAAAGSRETLEKHTYDNRVDTIVETVISVVEKDYTPERRKRIFLSKTGDCQRNIGSIPDQEQQATPLDEHDCFILGNSYKRQGQLDHAIEAYHNCLRINPDNHDALFNMGNALQESGQHNEAIEFYVRALKHIAGNPNLYNNMGNAYKASGNITDAMASYKKALELDPGSSLTYNNMANALLSIDRTEEAILFYKKAIALKPDYADAYFNLGTTFLSHNQHDRAIKCFLRVLEIEPDHARACFNLAVAYKETGYYDNYQQYQIKAFRNLK